MREHLRSNWKRYVLAAAAVAAARYGVDPEVAQAVLRDLYARLAGG